MQAERAHEHTHSPTPQPGVAGRSRNSSQNTHSHTAHPSQELQGASGVRTRAHTQPNTPARSGGAQPKPECKHTNPSRTPQPGVAGYRRSTHTSTHTAQHPSKEWRGAAETRAQTHTPTPHTPARSGRVQEDHAHQHTHTPTPQPGVARRSRNLSPNRHTHTAHPSQEWRGTGGHAHEHTDSPTPQPRVAGRSRNPSPKTHTHDTQPSQEWQGTSGAPTPAHTQPNTPARSGGAQPKPEPKHTHPHRTAQPGVAGYRGSRHQRKKTHTPTPQPRVAGCSRNPSPNTPIPPAHPSQEWRATRGAPTQAHTCPNTPARSGGAQPKPEPKHTQPHCTPQPGVAGYKRSAHTSTPTAQHPSQEWRGAAETRAQTTHTHTANPSQEWRGTGGAPTPAHTHPDTPARSGGAQPKPEPEHTHPHRTPQPGVAGYKQSAHSSKHTAQHPRQEWRGAAETLPQENTPTLRIPARSGGVQGEQAHKHAHPKTPARSGGVQPKPEPKHTHTHRTPQPGVARYKQSAHTSTNTPERPSQERRGAAERRAQAHTRTPHTPARREGQQGEHPHKHAQPNTPARSGGAQPKPEPKHTHPHCTPQPGVAGYKGSTHTNTHTPTPQPGVAGRSRNPSPNAHTYTAHPSQEWRGTSRARTPAHRHPTTPGKSGRVQGKCAHRHTHTQTPQPGVAGRSRNPSQGTHARTTHPSREWRGTSGARPQTQTHPNTPGRSGGAQRKPEPKHTHRRRTPQIGGAGYKRSTHISRHTPQHPSQEWRGAAETEPKHTHSHRTPHPGVAGCRRNMHTSSHKPRHPSRGWRGAAGTRTQPHTPTRHIPARSGMVQAERAPKRTHTRTPQPGVAQRSPNPNPTTTQTQTQARRNSRKPSVHSPGTEAARAMQLTRPNEIRSPGVRLHPKACAALGLEAELVTPKHLGTPVPRTCMHALGTGYARKSGEPLRFCPKEGTCTSTGAHPLGMTSSHAGGDQPSRCCPGPLCWGQPVRSSGM